jgi:3-oxoacyl-[acyl-carrier protein] reductase
MDVGLAGKIALVSGGSKGMGLAIARDLAADGAKVMVVARGAEAIGAAVRHIEEAGGTAFGLSADMHDLDGINAAVNACASAFGATPDIAIANVQGTDQFTFEQAGPDDFATGHSKLVMSALHLARAVLPGMKARRWGRMVTIGSFCAKQPHWHLPLAVDNVARAGALALSKTLANEFGGFGITVNTIAPGYIATDMALEWMASTARQNGVEPDQMQAQLKQKIPVGRQGTPEEIAAVCVFLCSTRASYVTGQTIVVDGGMLGSLY